MACIVKRRGRWVIDFYDNQGRRRWKTMPKGSTKKKARDKMREIEDQLRKGVWLPDQKVPIFKKVAEDWLEHKKPNIRESTWACYEGYVRNHFKDIEDVRINRISIAKVEKFITNRQNQGMNLVTLKKIVVTFGQIMTYAVRHRLIDYNPVRDAEKPKGQGKIKKRPGRVLTSSEIKTFIDSISNQKYRTLFMLALMSGARQGELLGLKWSDVDWINSQIHIQRTYNNGAWYLPKSKGSDRRIDIGPVMMKELKKWKLACIKNELDLIFPDDNGKVIDDSTMLRKHFYPSLEKAEIGRIRFHDMRHTYASLLIEQGENIKYIQTQLGHSSPSITLDVYSHLFKVGNQEAVIRLENAIFSKSGSKMVAK